MDGWLAHMPDKPGCYSLGVRRSAQRGRRAGSRAATAGPPPCHCRSLGCALLQHELPHTPSLLQPRSFLELGQYILALDLPPATKEALAGLAT